MIFNKYPKVNFIGNKEKIARWICYHFPNDATSVFDSFSGGCSLSYEAKRMGFEVYIKYKLSTFKSYCRKQFNFIR